MGLTLMDACRKVPLGYRLLLCVIDHRAIDLKLAGVLQARGGPDQVSTAARRMMTGG